MRDLWPLFRQTGPQPDGLHYTWEKAGLTVEGEAIPWNAEAVNVQGFVRIPSQTKPSRRDFCLRLGKNAEPILPDVWTPIEDSDSVRMTFRVPVPATSVMAELCWRQRSLGQLTMPVLSQAAFYSKLTLELATVGVRLREQTVACRTFVGSQCQGLVISAVLQGGTILAPILDLGLRVELRRPNGDVFKSVPVNLAATQLAARQALLTANLPRPRRLGAWEIVWLLEDRPIAIHKIKSISKPQFLRSLRLFSTRFVVQDDRGHLHVERSLPDEKKFRRAGPCFLVGSKEAGMAGLCVFAVTAQVKGAIQAPLLQEQEVLISDGPIPFVPGTLDHAELAQVRQFDLRLGKRILGILPLNPLPTARFDAEGAFVAAEAFDWSSAAEEQLQEKLGKLIGKI